MNKYKVINHKVIYRGAKKNIGDIIETDEDLRRFSATLEVLHFEDETEKIAKAIADAEVKAIADAEVKAIADAEAKIKELESQLAEVKANIDTDNSNELLPVEDTKPKATSPKTTTKKVKEA